MRVMKDSGIAWIGEIPEEWKVSTIKREYHFQTGWTPDTTHEDYFLGGNIWVNISDLKSATTYDSEKHISNEAVQSSSMNISPKGSLMYAFKLSVGAVSFCGRDMYTNEAIATFLPGKNSLRFLYYMAPIFIIKNANENIYGAKLLNQRLIRNAKIIIPPIAEQERIADYLDRKCSQIDAIIARQQEVIEKLKAYKLSVITEAVTKGLTPHAPMKDSGVEWIGEIPEHWEVRKAAFICDRLVVGVVIKPAEYFDDKGTIPFLRGINLKEYSINTDNLVYITDETNKMLSKSIVRSGDILIVRDGNIGVACVVPPFLDGANVVSMIIMTPMKRYNSCYICYFINSSIGKLQFELTKIGSALTHTSVSAVSKLRLAIPPEEEQNKIVEFLDEKCSSIEMLISKKQVIVDNLIAYKKSLIYEVVTGKKEV